MSMSVSVSVPGQAACPLSRGAGAGDPLELGGVSARVPVAAAAGGLERAVST